MTAPILALTVWQPWATLIMRGWKPFEFRPYACPRRVRGARIVVHAGKRKPTVDNFDRLTIDPVGSCGPGHADEVRAFIESVEADPARLPLACGLGTVMIGEPVRARDLFRPRTPDVVINPDTWAWPVTDPQPFPLPIPARGAQGFWRWVEP